MNFIQLPKPHGYLIWRGKQKAIASPIPIIHDRFLTLISEGEAYGDLALAQPAQVSISELERLESEHCLRPEERKLYYPDTQTFYIHRIKEWKPYQAAKAVHINGNSFEYLDYYPTSDEFEILNKAERLPKTITLSDDAVVLENETIIQDGLDRTKIEPVLRAVLEDAKLSDASLPLYQLALVRIPRLLFKEKKSEDEMPYKMVPKHPECKEDKPVGVVNKATGKLEGCSESMEMAREHVAAMMANEKKDAEVAEGEKALFSKPELEAAAKCEVYVDVPYGVYTFADLEAVEQAREVAQEASELSSQFMRLVGNIMSSPDVTDKQKALGLLVYELGTRLQQPGLEEKGEVEVSEDDGIYEADGYKATWTAKYVNSLPNSSFLYVEPDCDKAGCRHLPYKDASGKIDMPHLRAAASRLGQSGTGNVGGESWLTPEVRKRLQDKVSRMIEESKGEAEVLEDEKIGKRVRSSMMDKLKAAWETLKEFMDWAEPMEDEEMDMAKAFESGQAAIKMADGDYWHFAWSTNAFEDREGEIFSTKSLERYVEAAEKQNNRGFFNLWHIGTKENPGMSDFAEIKWQGVIGRILVEAGPYLPDEKGQAAKKFFRQHSKGHPELAPEGWGSSPEYRYLPEERKTGVYENIWKTRTSTLPRLAAANIWTDGGSIMALTQDQEKAAKLIFGEDQAKLMIEQAEDKTKELEQNVAHKGEDEVAPESTPEVKPTLEETLQASLQPFVEAMNVLAEQQVKLETTLNDISGRVKSLEKTEEIKTKTETPRALLFTQQRASQVQETAVAEDDPLTKMKPVETAQKDKSGAAAFFPAHN